MKKILIIFILFLSQCGFQPIYLGKNFSMNEFNSISYEGDKEINQKIINSLSFKENQNNINLDALLVKSSYRIIETKKNSSGKVESYKSLIEFNLIIKNKEKIITDKIFSKELSYDSKDNKFDLVQYQNKIKNDLINRIIEDIILFLNI
tara:strand:- start:230 stop:676 length:447 start_codon:yes stop_codon:yes gene_type:complete